MRGERAGGGSGEGDASWRFRSAAAAGAAAVAAGGGTVPLRFRPPTFRLAARLPPASVGRHRGRRRARSGGAAAAGWGCACAGGLSAAAAERPPPRGGRRRRRRRGAAGGGLQRVDVRARRGGGDAGPAARGVCLQERPCRCVRRPASPCTVPSTTPRCRRRASCRGAPLVSSRALAQPSLPLWSRLVSLYGCP